MLNSLHLDFVVALLHEVLSKLVVERAYAVRVRRHGCASDGFVNFDLN